MRAFAALLFVAMSALLSAFAQQVPTVPAIVVSYPHYQLRTKAEDACGVDYANIEVFGENRGWTARLQDGKYKQKSKFGYQAARLRQIYCIDGNGEDLALVIVDWSDCGASCTNVGIVQLILITQVTNACIFFLPPMI